MVIGVKISDGIRKRFLCTLLEIKVLPFRGELFFTYLDFISLNRIKFVLTF